MLKDMLKDNQVSLLQPAAAHESVCVDDVDISAFSNIMELDYDF